MQPLHLRCLAGRGPGVVGGGATSIVVLKVSFDSPPRSERVNQCEKEITINNVAAW